VYGAMQAELTGRLEDTRTAGTYKTELVMTTPQGAHVDVEGRGEMLNLCANNYLGLANHPEMIAAAHEALDRWGYGMASVRFICGTQALHRALEERISEFLHTEDTILFSSCFDANGGLFEALLDERDAVISDQLNHASIIDGIRLCKARRLRYANGDMDELESRLGEAGDARYRLIATDGVFSMDGYFARLDAICELAERHDALVMVDDSHAVGIAGRGGRGSHEHKGVLDRVDILTGTLGKAIGGASGGYVSARREVVELLRQRARPYLFSNSLAPMVAAASLRAIDLIETSHELRAQLNDNTTHFRTRMTELGFDVLAGEHPIVPVMVGDEVKAARLAQGLADRGVYAVSFSYPVVPKGTARIRTQMSAAHTTGDLDFAIEQFVAARDGTSREP
jgi:glycine C-acetyltransferase